MEGLEDFQPRMKTLQRFIDMDIYLTLLVTLGFNIFRAISQGSESSKYKLDRCIFNQHPNYSELVRHIVADRQISIKELDQTQFYCQYAQEIFFHFPVPPHLMLEGSQSPYSNCFLPSFCGNKD